ncbi:MAG: hypothetical protein JRH20_06430 [Deltaproteobacteria bacterium]|nr:hypothetical protein [Deltaproteobacteria bacterium]
MCDAQALNTACVSLVSDAHGGGVGERLELTAAVDTEFVVAVDSWSPSEVGRFTLSATVMR